MRHLLCFLLVGMLSVAHAQYENWDCATPTTSASCSTTLTALPYNGWTNDPGDVGSSFRIWTGNTGSVNTGPTTDVSGNGNYVYLETSCGSNPNVGSLVSPVFGAATVLAPTVRFSYHMWGATMGMLELQENDGAGNWTTIWMQSGDQGNMWILQEVAINTFDVGNGPEVQFRFRGTRGTSFTSDIALDEISFGEPGPPPPPPPPSNQPNSAVATLISNGAECIPVTVCPRSGPYLRTFLPGEIMDVMIDSGSNGAQAYTLAHTPGAAATTTPGIPTVAGLLDFSAAGLASVEFFVNGISGTSFIDLFLGTTLTNGTRSLQSVLGMGTPGTITTMQVLMSDPTSVFGVTLTAALQLDRSMVAGGLPANFIGATSVGASDDSTTQIVFNGFVFPFYGANYSDCWINSNGSVSFGPGGDTDLSESFLDLEQEEARVAPWWDDFNPATGGTLLYTENAADFVVTWTNVPEFGQTNSNTFAVFLDAFGTIQFAYGAMDAIDGLVGIGPGFNSPAGPANPTVGVSFAGAAPGTLMAGPQDSLVELFVNNPPVGGNACVNSLTLMSFIPLPGGLVPGDLGYIAP